MKEAAGRHRTLRVAAIQMIAAPGESESNRTRAEKLVEQAARDGATLVALPEMFAPGYLASRGVWDLAEPLGRGPTVAWLQRTARRLGIHVAGGLVETDGRDFFDSFVVCTPAGDIAGRAVKANAESYVFLRGRGAHIVDTSLGRLGIAICADNQFVHMPSFFHAHAVDVVLMPHAWPIPRVARGIVKEHDVRDQVEHVRSLPVLYATLLGVPIVFANQTGSIARVPGVLGRLLDPAVFAMGGQSRVVDSDGVVRASLDSGEGVATADVVLDPALKRLGEIPNHRGWLFPGSRVARELLMPIDIAWGRLSYTLSRTRAHTARELVHHGAKEFSGIREVV